MLHERCFDVSKYSKLLQHEGQFTTVCIYFIPCGAIFLQKKWGKGEKCLNLLFSCIFTFYIHINLTVTFELNQAKYFAYFSFKTIPWSPVFTCWFLKFFCIHTLLYFWYVEK